MFKRISRNYKEKSARLILFLYKLSIFLYKIFYFLYKKNSKEDNNFSYLCRDFPPNPCTSFSFPQQKQPEPAIHPPLQEANPPEYCSCSPTNYTVLRGSSAPVSAAPPSYPNDENPFHTDNS